MLDTNVEMDFNAVGFVWSEDELDALRNAAEAIGRLQTTMKITGFPYVATAAFADFNISDLDTIMGHLGDLCEIVELCH